MHYRGRHDGICGNRDISEAYSENSSIEELAEIRVGHAEQYSGNEYRETVSVGSERLQDDSPEPEFLKQRCDYHELKKQNPGAEQIVRRKVVHRVERFVQIGVFEQL